MSTDKSGVRDGIEVSMSSNRGPEDKNYIYGHGTVELRGPDGELKQTLHFDNLVTQVGDQMYGERASGVSSPPAGPTGMQLGTGTTAVAKTGAGAAIVTLVASSLVAIGTPTSSLNGSSRRITYVTTWAAGTATASAIAEVALVNQSTGTQTVAPAANTISRALLSPTINKAAGDTLTVTWNHDLLGA